MRGACDAACARRYRCQAIKASSTPQAPITTNNMEGRQRNSFPINIR